MRIFINQAVETIFYLNLGAPVDLQTHFVPLAAELFPELENLELLLRGPLIAAYARIDNIEPTFTTLARLAVTAWPNCLIEFLRYTRPRLGLIQIYAHALSCYLFGYILKNLCFVGRPR